MTSDAPTPQTERVPPGEWSDRDVDVIISNILRGGVITSSVFVLIGGVIFLMHHGFEQPHVSVFHGEPYWLRQPLSIVKVAFTGKGAALIQVGVLLLLATPFMRVAFSALAFCKQRDWVYVGIALIVLSALTFSLFAH
jgi:uncharacterized membrane protein